ncbi:GntR family transcriptional regulator [Undibacterium sp. SXout11W]|uniref:GntR family transcriptional regulator n=1 Tax=Undibacterium sp. SXout11W TaxID=3413050 RepID=UPI003BF35099
MCIIVAIHLYTMLYDIQTSSPIPIYRQIVEQVQRLIASGQLLPNDDLPSVRAVALHFAINPMTVSKAYSMLETAGSIVRKRGVGMAVAYQQNVSSTEDKLELLRPSLEAAAQVAAQLGIPVAEAQALFLACLQATNQEKDLDKNQDAKGESHE